MAEIRWTDEAQRWLHDIHVYIAEESSDATDQVVRGIYEKVQVLSSFPEIGQKFRSEKDGEIRILLYGHHRIVYLVRPKGRIDILGVFHGALDIERYFF